VARPRRDQTRRDCDDADHQSGNGEGPGVVRRQAEEHRLQQPRCADGTGEPDGEADNTHHHALAQHHPEHLITARAQRDPHTDLRRTTRNPVRQSAVQAGRDQYSGKAPEHQREPRE